MHSNLSAPPTVAVQQLGRIYRSGDHAVVALRDVNLMLASGTFTAVMGPSGSGKSTLLNCIAGLESPTSGSVWIDGEDISDWSASQRTVLRRERIGIVFQGFHLIPYLSVEQNVGLPIRLAGRRPDPTHVRDLLKSVGLADRGEHLPTQLSGGQQQRVAIARAMATSPAVMLADEPTGALDSTSARGVLDLLRQSVDSRRQTILMVTHDPVAAARADRVIFLLDGARAGQLDNPSADIVSRQIAHLDEMAAERPAAVTS